MYCKICGYMLRKGEETKICPICGSIFNDENLVKEEGDEDTTASNEDSEEGNTTVLSEDPEEGSTTVLSEDPEEGNTTVLKQDPDEEGTTVLTGNEPVGAVILNNGNAMPGRTPLAPNGMPLYPEEKNNRTSKKQEKELKKASKKASKKKMSKGKKIAVFAVIFVIVAVLGTIGVLFGLKISKYSKAESALKKGNIEEAVELYGDAVPYKDSKDMANGGAYYKYAELLLEDENYQEAAEYFEKAAEAAYNDAETRLQECYINYANRLFDEGKYEEAITYYEMVGETEDTEMAEKINSCKYMLGCSLMDEEDYEGAIEVFEGLESYEDSEEKIKECYYYQALIKMEAEEYEEARDLFLKAESSDGERMANDCLYLLAVQYEDAEDYENAIAIYEQIDSSYKDCSSNIENAYISWGDKLVDGKDYQTAVEIYLKADNSKTGDKINDAKAAYIKANFDMSDETTMSYVCDLKYANYDNAVNDYKELTGWTVNSFVNYEENNIDDKEETVTSDKDIYVHTTYSNENDESLNLTGYIIYSDGSKSNEVSFSDVTSDKVSWFEIAASSAPAGDTTLYLYDTDSGNLFEKYTFTIN